MLHPTLHSYLAGQHQRELERKAERGRLLAEARQAATGTAGVAERAMLGAGRLLIDAGQRLCARSIPQAQHTPLSAATHDVALAPLITWSPALLARLRDVTATRESITFVYYGFITAGPHGITRAEYLTPLARPIASVEGAKRG